MDRRIRLLAVVVSVVVSGAACSDDDGDDGGSAGGPPTTADDRAPATLPDEVEPGRGAMVLDGEASVLTVVACELEPSTDDATGVTTELRAVADDGLGRTVQVTRERVAGDLPTVTDSVRVVEDGSGAGGAASVVAERVDRDGLLLDLREPNPVGRLLEVDASTGTIAADGVFGPDGSTAEDPGNVDGELLLRCP